MIVGEALFALQYVPGIETTAIFGRPQSVEKARELAGQYHIPSVFTDYGEMLEKADADFIYIGNINSVHYEFAREALLSGKNLIVEKPMCPTEAEVQALADLAHERGLYIFEALTFLHAPFFKELKEELLPEVGKVRMVQCNYSKYSSRYDRYLKGDVAPVFSPECAGGTLLDLNIYNLNFVIALFGEPESVNYTANLGFNGIDTSGCVVMKYPGFVAVCSAAKDSYSPCFDMVQGEEGWLKIDGSPDTLHRMELFSKGKSRTFGLVPGKHRMVDEFKAFARIYHEHDYAEMNRFLSHSILVARIAERALGCLH